jgi:hypothetical protein
MSEEEFQELKTKVAVLLDRSDAQQKTVADLVNLNSTLKTVSSTAAVLGLGGLGSLAFSALTYVHFLSEQTHVFNRPVQLVTKIDGASQRRPGMTGFSLISAVAGAYFPEHAPKSVNLSSLKHLEWGRATEIRRWAFPPCSQFFRLNHFTESLKQAPEFINAHTIETPRLFTR